MEGGLDVDGGGDSGDSSRSAGIGGDLTYTSQRWPTAAHITATWNLPSGGNLPG